MELRDLYDVTAYGADVTGVADSTVATRNALAAAANVTATGRRTVVYFPAGTFRFIMKTTQRHLDVNGISKLVFLGAPGGRSRLKLAGSAGLGDWYQPFKGGQMATQRNYLILRNHTQSSTVLGCAADHQGKSQAIDFQCCIFAPLKGW